MLKRESGILLHITSLPSKYGIGDLGQHSYDFVDFLVKGNQKIWQLLPLNPTGFKDSPYQSFSTFAGNPLLICPDLLIDWNLLTGDDFIHKPEFSKKSVEYGKVILFKDEIYRKAFVRFQTTGNEVLNVEFELFVNENESWLEDFALFMALKNYFIKSRKYNFKQQDLDEFTQKNVRFLTTEQITDNYYGAVWQSWPEDISKREKKALDEYRNKLRKEIGYQYFLQFLFFKQFGNLKTYANKNGIKIIGDIPIFVALDSADCWANPESFLLDGDGNPKGVAGVPPDYFSEDGQLWGNPLYDWDVMKKEKYSWWVSRIESALKLSDILRIDHFRGFAGNWQIPYGSKTAKIGKWVPGAGQDLFDEIKKQLGELPIIAEDLGVITPDVEQLRDDFGLPGMKVIQFGFDGGVGNGHLPLNFDTNHRIVYTGTHDNDTAVGWYESQDKKIQDQLRRYLNVSGEDVAWDMIRLAMLSNSKIAIIPIQDILRQGKGYRMNIPGTSIGNWQYRVIDGQLEDKLALDLLYLSTIGERNI